MFTQLSQNDIIVLKKKLWLQNDKKCPLLNTEIPFENMVLDHIHKLKSDDISEQKGTIRNAIERRANALEGKITNNWKRYFGSDESKHPIPLPDFLRNLANYLEAGAYFDGSYYIHPSEKVKLPNVSKSNYNKLSKEYAKTNPKKKLPEYPKSKKLTKSLEVLFNKFNISPYN